jgi:beta-glucosidase
MAMTTHAQEILAFPPGFLWGTATAAHQVEGNNTNNDWWAWEQTPGHIADGSRSGLAANWWQAAEQDLALAAQWGQNSHRLSLEWSRLEPREGAWDEGAVARYRQILEYMRGLGLVPMVTLHHFTNPLWLYEQGGWENERVVSWFARYVERVVKSFGDLCHLWCTLNEPMVYMAFGYLSGIWPPGGGGLGAVRKVLRHMAQAHAQAYEILHRHQADAQVGFAKHFQLFEPAEPRRRADRWATRLVDHLFNESILVALTDGALLLPLGPDLGRRGGRWADFMGLNYYARNLVAFDPRRKEELFTRRFPDPQARYAVEGWGEVTAEGLYRGLKRFAAWGLPIYVTEFGVPDNDDHVRPWFLVEHVVAMYRALQEGVPLKGAYFWSLVDNFEWAAGWSARFGLLALDPATQERRPRPSAEVYRRIVQANGLERSLVAEFAPQLESQFFDRGC